MWWGQGRSVYVYELECDARNAAVQYVRQAAETIITRRVCVNASSGTFGMNFGLHHATNWFIDVGTGLAARLP